MKQNKNKIREPYPPEQTPQPPQIIDPSIKEERNEDDNPVEDRKNQPKGQRQDKRPNGPAPSKKESEKRLSDETKVEDERPI